MTGGFGTIGDAFNRHKHNLNMRKVNTFRSRREMYENVHRKAKKNYKSIELSQEERALMKLRIKRKIRRQNILLGWVMILAILTVISVLVILAV